MKHIKKHHIVLLLVPLVALTGCTNSADNKNNHKEQQAVEQPAMPPEIHIDSHNVPLDRVMPLDPITVATTGDNIQVSMLNTSTGEEVQGDIIGNTWNKTTPLQYDNSYRITATSGETTQVFDVYAPKPLTAEPTISIPDGATVGVGQTVAVRFDAPIEDKQLVEKGITVETAPHVNGAFRWVNDREVRWRPAEFFAPGTQIHVKVNNYGQYLGGGFFGGTPTEATYSIGDKRITIVDNATKMAHVFHNDNEVYSFPVSLGKPSAPTNNGIYIIGDRNPSMIMDSSTYGVAVDSAEGYRVDVNYATQMSYSGIYLHSAPWAAGAIGSYNQSHGCINAMPDDAQWFMENSNRGDIVIVKNADGSVLSMDDGLGDWNGTLDEWDSK